MGKKVRDSAAKQAKTNEKELPFPGRLWTEWPISLRGGISRQLQSLLPLGRFRKVAGKQRNNKLLKYADNGGHFLQI